jgi:outer membrane immunogenic protein
MKKILGGLALSVFLAAPVMAADMPVKAAPAPLPTIYSWTGCYIGGHVAVAWGRKKVNDLTPLGISNFDHDLDGFGGGGQVGCNVWQSDRWVLGIEAQATWIDMDNEVRNNQTFGVGGFRTDADIIGSIAGRLGYAAGSNGQVLFFVKGGAAFIHEKFGAYLAAPGPTLFSSDNDLRWGWMVGGGAEAVLWGNWTWKGEYNYSNFGTRNVEICNGGLCDTFSVKQHVHLVKFGLNYRFTSWGAGPLVARY